MTQQFDPAALARIITEAPEPAACAACLDQLEPYIAAQLVAGSVVAAARFPAVARHLDACVACSESYALLYETLALPAKPPVRVPAPNLSFLPRLSLLERVGTALVFHLSQALAAPPPLAGALRSASAPLLDVQLDAPDAALAELRVSAYARPEHPERCDLRVLVVPLGRAWPALDGTVVTLRGGALTQTAQTDQYGELVFADLPVAALAGLVLELAVTSA